VKIKAEVQDGAGSRNHSFHTLRVADSLLKVQLVPENMPLMTGYPNRIFIFTSRPGKGAVAARCQIRYQGCAQPILVDTDASGLGTFDLTPQSSSPQMMCRVTARDNQGNVEQNHVVLSSNRDAMIIRTDKTLYKAGESLNITVVRGNSSPFPSCYLDVVKAFSCMPIFMMEPATIERERKCWYINPGI